MTDLADLQKFLEPSYRESYLDSHVKGSIAYQIQGLREKLGLNQTEFGALIGMPQSVVSRLEQAEGGAVNIKTLLRIANKLGIGLSIRFCGFDVILDEDVSPQGLSVETVEETIARMKAATVIGTEADNPEIGNVVQIIKGRVPGSQTWQMKQIPNQRLPLLPIWPGCATPSLEKYMQTPASLAWDLSTSH